MKKITLPKITVLEDTPNDPYSVKVGWDSLWTDGIGGAVEGYFISKQEAKEYRKFLKKKTNRIVAQLRSSRLQNDRL